MGKDEESGNEKAKKGGLRRKIHVDKAWPGIARPHFLSQTLLRPTRLSRSIQQSALSLHEEEGSVFVQIVKCICPNCKMDLSKLQNVFVLSTK